MNLVFLSSPGLNEFQQAVVAPFLQSDRHSIRAVVIDDRPPRSTMKKLKSNLRQGRGGYVVVMAFRSLFGGKPPSRDAGSFFEGHNIPVIRTTRPYSEETLGEIRDHEPEALVLLGGFGIVRKGLIQLTANGVLSYHHGNMRTYRGMPPGLWEVYNGEREMGVTVQTLDVGLDSGEPIVEMTVPIRYTDTPGSLRERALGASAEMMFDAACRIEDPDFTPETIETYGTLYTLPNLRQWITLQAKLVGRKFKAMVGAGAW